MRLLLGIGDGATGPIVSYFGAMDFLDNQASFNDVFGVKPALLGCNPTQNDLLDISSNVYAYADKCMFDVFLSTCREDYVGSVTTTSH